jgi:uncharacterized membrane protein YvbJ
VTPLSCRNCGTQLPPESVFCPECGTVPQSDSNEITLPGHNPVSSPRRRYSFSKGKVATMVVLVIIVVIGVVSYALLTVMNVSHLRRATATAQAVNYNTYVATYGIMYGFDAQHTRNNHYESILNGTNVSQLRQKWAVPTSQLPLAVGNDSCQEYGQIWTPIHFCLIFRVQLRRLTPGTHPRPNSTAG